MATEMVRDRLLSEQEAAQFLGIQPQTLSIWRYNRRYPLPFIRVGRLIRYRQSACEQFLVSRTVGAAEA